MAKTKPAVAFAEGPAPEHASFVPRRALKVSKQPQALLQQAAQSSKKELWLLQLPADVSVESLRGVELYMPAAGTVAPSTSLQGSDYQLADETPLQGSASSQVVSVILGQQAEGSQQPTQAVVPVRRRMALVRRCTAAALDGYPQPVQPVVQALQSPASEARPTKKAKVAVSHDGDGNGQQGTGTTTAPTTPSAKPDVEKRKKAKKDKSEKHEKKEKSSKKEKKSKPRDSDSDGGGTD